MPCISKCYCKCCAYTDYNMQMLATGTYADTYTYAYAYTHTVSFHNFKSQNFKLSVSNPKSKYAACLSVLSQISNCQGLGRKNKREILKTDRIPMPMPIRIHTYT